VEASEEPLLSAEEEIELAYRIRKGDGSARDRMIRANLRLVVKLAREYEGMGLPLLDLISEGNIGLMRAVEYFDPRKGAKLSTYAALWIRQQIRRALANQGRTIRLPVYMVNRLSHFRKAETRLRQTLDREPTDEELADVLQLPVQKVARLRTFSVQTTSLDAPVGDDEGRKLGDLIAAESEDPGSRMDRDIHLDRMSEFLGRLPQRESVILKRRFGLDGSREWTLEEIGASLGLTRERIRQLQNHALRQLHKWLSSEVGGCPEPSTP